MHLMRMMSINLRFPMPGLKLRDRPIAEDSFPNTKCIRSTPKKIFSIIFAIPVLCIAIATPSKLSAKPSANAYVSGITKNPSIIRSSDSALLVQELKRLTTEIKEKSRPISLGEAISLGISKNPQLAQAFYQIQQYEWQLISVQRQWYPTAQLDNGNPFIGYNWQTYIQSQYSTISSSQPTSQSNINYQQLQSSTSATSSAYLGIEPGFTLSWTFLDPTRQPNINAASLALKQQKLLFDTSARNLILSIQQTYYQVQSTQQLIDSFNEIYSINERQLSSIDAQRRIGMATVLDLEQQQSQLFIQLNQLVQYTRDYISQSAQLAQLLGLNQNELAIPSDAAILAGEWKLSLEETISKAIETREEIKASIAAAESARWSGLAALRSYLPSFQLVGTGSLLGQSGTQGVPVGSGYSDPSTNSRFWSAAVGLGFTWTMYDGGIQAGNAQALYAQERQQRSQAVVNRLEVVQQVRSSYGQYLTSVVAVQSAQRALTSARKAQEAAQARFQIGVGDITSVVQAIQQLSQSAQILSSSILSYNSSLAQLYRYSSTWPSKSHQAVVETVQSLKKSSK